MRRTVLLLATMALTLLVASGVALAETKIGTNGPDFLKGTNGSDWIEGRGGKDVISGGPGDDELFDGQFHEGAVDTLEGGVGNDFLIAKNGPAARDIVSCGAGRNDWAEVDRKDIVSDDCEKPDYPQAGDDALNDTSGVVPARAVVGMAGLTIAAALLVMVRLVRTG
jgi:Ca2+-binding RTX toxin-like protein